MMLKLFVGLVGAVALTVLGHAALVHSSSSESVTAPGARSTCAVCHG